VKELAAAVAQFSEERGWGKHHAPKNLVMALSVEVAELVEHFTWLTAEQSTELGPEELQEVADEVGDVLIYLVNLCSQLGIDPVRAAHEKLEKAKRKYPAEAFRDRPEPERARGPKFARDEPK
jgi:dCTP diphosphatase